MASLAKSKSTINHSRVIERSPIFYGWVIALVATIGMIATAPGQSFTVSLFIDHYIADFGIDRTMVSTLFSLGTFTAALSLTWVGKYIDKHGNRSTGIVIAALFAIALVAISRITGPFTLFLSFFAIRFLGQGSLFLVSSTAIARWWVRDRGWVMGLALVGFALFRWQYQPGLQHLIDDIGWRQVWVVLGLAVGVIVVPLWAVFMRDQPEQYGVLPDGDRADKTKNDAPDEPVVDEVNWTLSQAQHTMAFWVFLFGRLLAGAWGTGLVFHQISIFEQVGYSATTTAATFGTIGLTTAFFTPIIGRFISRIRPGFVMAVQLAATITALLLSLVMTETWMLTPYIISFGLLMALGGAFNSVVWADLFGRLHHGAIRGFVATGMVIGTSIGPIVFGFSYDYLGGYAPVVYFGVILILIEIGLCLVVTSPTLNPETQLTT
jgi:MFS transporter, OFA family, oxalate/formate antiporter